MKVVLDSNVLIAAFVARGTCAELVEYCVRQQSVVASRYILEREGGTASALPALANELEDADVFLMPREVDPLLDRYEAIDVDP